MGSGTGDRVYAHAIAALVEGASGEDLKLDTIRAVRKAGLDVGVEIIRHKLERKSAYEVEAGVIDALRLTGIPLTNKAAGKDSIARGWHPMAELRALYEARDMDPTSDRLMFVKINRLYHPTMTDDELYEATRQSWKCNPARNPQFALALYNGIVRAVYTIDSWDRVPRQPGDKWDRWAFRGVRASDVEDRYVWRRAPDKQRRAQYPITYLNC